MMWRPKQGIYEWPFTVTPDPMVEFRRTPYIEGHYITQQELEDRNQFEFFAGKGAVADYYAQAAWIKKLDDEYKS